MTAAVFVWALAPGVAVAQAGPQRIAVDGMLGAAHAFDRPLTISQEGHSDLELTAHYRGESFDPPLYYALRVRFLQERSAWEVQFIHLKIVLTNPPPEVQHFEVSHGYNLLTVNRSWSDLPVTLRVGGGLVIPHPESTVRGLAREGASAVGYELSGPAFLVGAGKELALRPWLSLTTELQLTLAWAHVTVAEGEATVPTTALHGMLGLGFRF